MTTVGVARCIGALAVVVASTAAASFEVSTSPVGFGSSAVATDASGVSLVVWGVDDVPSTPAAVLGQRFDAAGERVGPAIQVSTTPGTYLQRVELGKGAGGHLVAVWAIYDAGGYHVRARRFDPAGTPLGSDIEVAAATFAPIETGVGVDPSGAFLVAWNSIGATPGDDVVRARLFDATGAPTGPAFPVNTSPAHYADVDAVHTGTQYVVAWSGIVGAALKAQRFDGTGAPIGGEIAVAPAAEGVSLAADAAGNVVIASVVSNAVVRAWRYDGSGSPLGAPIDVGTELAYVFWARVGVAPSGAFVVAWAGLPGSGTDDTRVRVRRLDAAGTPITDEFEVTPPGERNDAPAIDLLPPLGFFATWTHDPFAGGTVEGLTWRPEMPVRGMTLQIRDPGPPTGRRLKLKLRDPQLTTLPDIGLDPLGDGVAVQVFGTGGSGDSACVALPSSGWMPRASRRFPHVRYADSEYALGPCRTARAIAGELTVSCTAKVQPIDYSLDEPSQGTVAIRVTSGDVTYCTEFGGVIRKDRPGAFRAKLADRPAACAVPPPCP